MASTDEKNTINITTTPSTSIITAMSGALKPPMKMLSNADLAEVCRKIGAPPSRCAIEPPSVSNGTIPPPPANDVPSGLYKEVISARKRAQYNYYFTATLYNTCIVLQLLLGASLTALGSSTNTTSHGLSITILAAANTVNAGIIALLHNSGLPNRIKQDWNEFAKVEAYLEVRYQISLCVHKYLYPLSVLTFNIPTYLYAFHICFSAEFTHKARK
jgi:hypothetical protein